MLDHLARFVSSQPWALTPETMAIIHDVGRLRAASARWSKEAAIEGIQDFQAGLAAAAAAGRAPMSAGGVAVIGIRGIITQHAMDASWWSPSGASCERIGQLFAAALVDPAAGSILFDVDSPGGSVLGMCELADKIRAARGQKRMVAIARSEMCSAAYTIASAADEIVVMPMSHTGSIGVWGSHTDWSVALEQAGMKITLISSGRYKTEGNSFEPLTEEAKAQLQKNCDEAYDLMTATIAKNRGVSPKVVRGEAFGEGRAFGAKEAVDNGLADRMDTLEGTLARMLKPGRKSSGASAESADIELRLRSLAKRA